VTHVSDWIADKIGALVDTGADAYWERVERRLLDHTRERLQMLCPSEVFAERLFGRDLAAAELTRFLNKWEFTAKYSKNHHSRVKLLDAFLGARTWASKSADSAA
jgi:hypothetical protein